MCLYPTASEIDEKPLSLTLPLRPLTIEDATDGPLKTNAEYSWINDAPEIIEFHADSLESIPPTPTIGIFPSVSLKHMLITSSERDRNGLPERPPSFAKAFLA